MTLIWSSYDVHLVSLEHDQNNHPAIFRITSSNLPPPSVSWISTPNAIRIPDKLFGIKPFFSLKNEASRPDLRKILASAGVKSQEYLSRSPSLGILNHGSHCNSTRITETHSRWKAPTSLQSHSTIGNTKYDANWNLCIHFPVFSSLKSARATWCL